MIQDIETEFLISLIRFLDFMIGIESLLEVGQVASINVCAALVVRTIFQKITATAINY